MSDAAIVPRRRHPVVTHEALVQCFEAHWPVEFAQTASIFTERIAIREHIAGGRLNGFCIGAEMSSSSEGACISRSSSKQAVLLEQKGGEQVSIVSRSELAALDLWPRAFGHLRKDRRYFEIVEDTICPEFEYRYFAIRDQSGQVCTIQPFFVLDQDLLAGVGARAQALAGAVRRVWPQFLKMRTLMVGCAGGEGHLQSEEPSARRAQAEILAANICHLARLEKASLIVLKEFPAEYRSSLSCFLAHGFSVIPSMPMTRLDISQYSSFDDYLSKAIKAKRRTEFRRKFKAAEQSSPIELEVTPNAEAAIDEIYALYEQVFERSKLQFEKLTKSYFREVGRRMPDKARFFLWRQDGKLIAFSYCLIQGDTLYGECLGLDYTIALKLHLYFYVMRDTIAWAIANGFKSIVSTSLGYGPKLQMRHLLEPLDLYVRHTSPLMNAVFRRALPLLEPTRGEKTLKKFPNYHELWSGPG
jgi:predicted N-acyltransferase